MSKLKSFGENVLASLTATWLWQLGGWLGSAVVLGVLAAWVQGLTDLAKGAIYGSALTCLVMALVFAITGRTIRRKQDTRISPRLDLLNIQDLLSPLDHPVLAEPLSLIAEPQFGLLLEEGKVLAKISPKEILDKVGEVPSRVREQYAAQYIGWRVSWSIDVTNVSGHWYLKDKGVYQVTGISSGDSIIIAEVRDDYNLVLLDHKKTVTIEGLIKRLDIGLIVLSPAKIVDD